MPGGEPPSPQESDSGQTHAFTRKPLSCTNCRERKVKCDRASRPCVPCRKHVLECIFPARRVRAPKIREAPSQTVDGTQLANARLLEGNDDRSNGRENSTSHLIPHDHPRSSSFIFAQPNDSLSSKFLHPSIAHMKVMYDVYFANIDPVCKILHRPTANQHLLYMETLLDLPTRKFHSSSLDAVAFAMYFAAVNTLSPQNCMTLFSEEKGLLLERYRHGTEELLVQANLLSTSDTVTLQALTIYIIVQRSLTRARETWALIGLAIRLAQGCNLHMEGKALGYSPFEAEMRRRLWWQILLLETIAADERSSQSLLPPDSFNAPLPCNLNDDDFSLESQHPLQGRNGPTDMTLCLLGIDATRVAQKLKPWPKADEEGSPSVQDYEDIVRDYAKRFESIYLTGCDFSKPRTKVLSTVGYHWMYKLWLLLYYPLSHQVFRRSQPPRQGLQLALMFLRHNAILEHHSVSQDFAWFYRSHVPWHAVAVVLTELCREPRGTHADRAWNLIDPCFDEWSDRIGDSKLAMVWSHVKLLRERVRSMRQGTRDSDKEPERMGLLPVNSLATTDAPTISNVETVNWGDNDITSDWHPMGGNFDLSDEALDITLSSLPFEPVDANGWSTPYTQDEDRAWENFNLNVHSLAPS